MKKFFLVFFVLFFKIFISFSFAQTILFKAKVFFQNETLHEVTVNLKENKKTKKIHVTGIDGIFEFKLAFNKTYFIEVKKDQFIRQIIEIKTKVSKSKKQNLIFEHDINMLKMIKNLDISLFENPISLIVFDEKKSQFKEDEDYEKKINSEKNNFKKSYKKAKKEIYKIELKKAKTFFENKRFKDAKIHALKAKNWFPEKDEINDFLDKFSNDLNEDKNISFIEVKGKIFYKDENLSGVKIKIFENYQQIDFLETKEDGSFNFFLITNYVYYVVFSKKDFVSQKVEFQTLLRDKKVKNWPFFLELTFFKMQEDWDVNFLEEPVKKIKIDDNQRYFEEIWEYSQKMNGKINQLRSGENPNVILTQEEKIEKEKKYQIFIDQADNFFQNKRYDLAIKNYEKSLKIKPAVHYPRNKIKEAKKLWEIQKNRNNYEEALNLAEQLFKDKEYESSLKQYKNALENTNEKEDIENKIEELEEIIKEEKKINKNYTKLINLANQDFEKKDYDDAKKYYEKALLLKSEEKYPKRKIETINYIFKQEKLFKNLVENGKKFLDKKDFETAKEDFEMALEIKEDKDVQILLKEATKNLKKEHRKLYRKHINKGSDFIKEKDFEQAILEFKKAEELFPDEALPKEKLLEIKNLQSKTEPDKTRVSKIDGVIVDYELYLKELAKTAPEGISESTFTDEKKTVRTVIVNKKGTANEYKEVKHAWGGLYYFKNGENISKNVFQAEIKKAKQ